jgi:argininosuccinate lyase
MERAAGTDQRIDDLAAAMRDGFSRVDQDIRDLRLETREGFAELRTEINDLRLVMLRAGGAMIVGLVGVITAILARGV